MKTQIEFDTYPVNAAVDPSGGYVMKLKEQQIVNDDSVFEEVVKEKTLPLSPDLLEFAFRTILSTMALKVSTDCRPRKIGNYLKATPYLRGKLKGPFSAYDPATCSCAIVFTSLSGLDKKVNTDKYIRFVNSRTGTKVVIDRITYEGSTSSVAVIMKGRGVVVTGLNCQWLDGDSCTLVWKDSDGTERTASIVPTESSVTEMRFVWPTVLDGVTEGTEVEFRFLTRGGIAEADPQPNNKKVTVLANDDPPVPPTPTLTGISPKLDPSKEWQSAQPGQEGDASLTVITGTGLAGCEFWIEYDDPDPEQGGRGAAEFVAELATDTRVEGTSFLQADWNAVMQVKKNGVIVAQHAFTPVQE